MADLAFGRQDASAEPDWSGAGIPFRPRQGFRLFRVKASKRGEGLSARFGLPGVGEASQRAAWVGAAEWLLLVPADEGSEMIGRLEEERVAGRAYWAELSDGLLCLESDHPAALIAELTGLPEAALAVGHSARTHMAGMAVLFIGTEAGISMIFERSYQRHLRAWLDRAI